MSENMVICIVLGIILLALGIIIFSILHLNVRVFADAKGYELNILCRYWSIEFISQKDPKTSATYLVVKILGWKMKKVFGRPKKQEHIEQSWEEKEENQQEKDILDLLSQIELIYQSVREDLFAILRYFRSKLKVDRFWIISQIGLEDAAETAIAAGIFYALMSPVSAAVYQNFTTKSMKIEAKPCYNETVLNINCDTAVQIRVVYLVILAVKVLKLVRKATKINSLKVKERSS